MTVVTVKDMEYFMGGMEMDEERMRRIILIALIEHHETMAQRLKRVLEEEE